MYAAEVVEEAPVTDIFSRPHMPYTWGLLGSLPRLDHEADRLVQIKGQPPSMLRPPSGCRFHPRCPYVMDICLKENPQLKAVTGDEQHSVACHLDEETKDREARKLVGGTVAEAAS
jgi:oligopeptide/dipeptide ABC transporter ATP-binding protein